MAYIDAYPVAPATGLCQCRHIGPDSYNIEKRLSASLSVSVSVTRTRPARRFYRKIEERRSKWR